MGEIAKVAEAFSAPIVKFIEVVSRGIGCAYEPTHTRKMADAKAYEITTIAKALRDNADLPAFFDRDGVQIDLRDINALAERASRRALLQEMRKQQNIEAIVDRAYEEIQKETEVSSEQVDDDWIVRFFNSVEDVSKEDLQKIWSRVLAEEIKKPKSFSMRTLDILKNISLSEARLFQDFSFCLLSTQNRVFIPNDEAIWSEVGLQFGDVYTLSCAGLINLTTIDLLLDVSQRKALIYNQKIVGTIERKETIPNDIVHVNIYCLTESGMDIAKVLNINDEKSKNFAVKFFSRLKKVRNTYIIRAYLIMNIYEGYIKHETQDLLIE
ncbi:MAG: DUF2806 domain-containing protein [Christensenella sp.]|nr:DUF2806 domain-containing protein [Christensenella sp.]